MNCHEQLPPGLMSWTFAQCITQWHCRAHRPRLPVHLAAAWEFARAKTKFRATFGCIRPLPPAFELSLHPALPSSLVWIDHAIGLLVALNSSGTAIDQHPQSCFVKPLVTPFKPTIHWPTYRGFPMPEIFSPLSASTLPHIPSPGRGLHALTREEPRRESTRCVGLGLSGRSQRGQVC